MVTEIAQIDITPGMESEFEAGVGKARAVFGRARGFKTLELHRSIEKPGRYRRMSCPLTDPSQFDILRCGLGSWGADAIGSAWFGLDAASWH